VLRRKGAKVRAQAKEYILLKHLIENRNTEIGNRISISPA
jgi:hypothetical protein